MISTQRIHYYALLPVALLLTLSATSASVAANPVMDENALTGTHAGWSDWDAQNRLIEGYASEVSVQPGDTLHLHVSTKPAANYRVEIYRIGWYGGAGARLMTCIPSCSGVNPVAGATQPMPTPEAATGLISAAWPITDNVPIGANWVSGYYVAKIRLVSGSAGVSTVPFVVRALSNRPKVALVQISENTWQAYNNWGGKSLYDNNSTGGRAYKVSFNRPYMRTNWSLFDYEIQMVRFLEREGIDVAYQAELDTHTNPALLSDYTLVMPIGHGEYWTKEMRDGFESARDSAVNLGFFGANMAYWQMRYENSGRTIVEYKSTALDPQVNAALKTDQFRLLNPPRPECQLMGVHYQEGNWAITGAFFHRDYAVNAQSLTDPWFSETGFVAGDTLGLAVGYEWDATASGCATPLSRVFFHYQGGSAPESAHAIRYVAPSGARVFATGSLNWTWRLDDWFRTGDPSGHVADPKLQQFTRNVLNDLLSPVAVGDYPPVAALTSDTVSPIVGHAVTLTDTSLDQDGTLVARAWDLDNDGVFNDGSAPSVQVTFPAAGAYQVALKVTDNTGLTEITHQNFIAVTPALPLGNTTANASFEAGITSWISWQGLLTPLADANAVEGDHIVRVSYKQGNAFTINTANVAVNALTQGHTYVGSAWVRAGSPASIGKSVVLKIREKTPAGVIVNDIVGSAAVLASTSAFQQIRVSGQAIQTSNQMDIRVSMNSAAQGDSFDVDLVTLVDASVTGTSNTDPIAAILVPTDPIPVLQTVTLTDVSSDADPSDTLLPAWDLHGTRLFNEGSGATASLIFTKPGIYPVTLNVSDTQGLNANTTRYVTVVSCLTCPVNNLTANPSFEVWVNGWTSQGAIQRIADANAVDGGFVGRISVQSGGVMTFLDSPRTVTSTVSGHAYKGGVYVRAGTPNSVGKTVQLKMREWSSVGAVVKETASPTLKLTANFQAVSVTANAQNSGSQMDIRVSVSQPTSTDAVDVDVFTLVDLNQ